MERDAYIRSQQGSLESLVHRQWAERLGNVGTLFNELVFESSAEGRLGQGNTTLRAVAGAELFVKIYTPDRWHRRIREVLGRHRAIEEWKATRRAEEAGVPAAPIIAAMTLKRFWRCYHLVITEPAVGNSMQELLVARKNDQEGREELLRDLGRRVAEWHHAGFHHAHLNLQHIFRGADGSYQIIDFEASSVRYPLSEAARQHNLRQLKTSLRKTLKSDADHPALLVAYGEARRSIEAKSGGTAVRPALGASFRQAISRFSLWGWGAGWIASEATIGVLGSLL